MPYPEYDHDLQRGLRNRRAILGDDWVNRSVAGANTFNADYQSFITRYAWHEVWGRPGLDARTRRIIVLAITTALGRWEEFELHLRAGLRGSEDTRLSPQDVQEVLLQAAIYAGVPAANTAVAHAMKILRELDMAPQPSPATEASHPGVGRPWRTASDPALRFTVREPRSGQAPRLTVLLSHALGCDAMMWDALANALASEHRVVCYDHRGHGGSAVPPGPYTLVDMADDAARLIDELGHGPVVFAGLSLGGMVAQTLALRHPDKVRALVVANSSASYPDAGRAAWDQRIAAIRDGGLEAIADGAMQRWFHPGFHAAQPATIARWRERVVTQDAAGYIACCQAIRDLNTLPELGRVQVPTLVIAGELDEATPPAMSEAIAGAIPGAQLQVLPQASHLSVLEQPAAFERTLHGFLDGLRG